MAPYVILVFAPYFLAMIMRRSTYEENQLCRRMTVMAFFLLFFLLLAFRANTCGTDLFFYERFFRNTRFNEWAQPFTVDGELGYFYLQKLVHLFSENFYVFSAIVAFLSLLPWCVFCLRETDNAVLTIAIFVAVAPFSMFFSGLRQILAMAMAVPVWYCVRSKKWMGLIVSVMLACSFHRSAWMIACIIPLYYLSITRKWLLWLAPAGGLVLVFNKPLFAFLVKLIGESDQTISDTGGYAVLILLVLFVIYAFFITDEERMDRDTVALRNILVLSVFLQCFAPIHTLAMRMNYYFLPFVSVLIPRVTHRARFSLEKVGNIATVVMVVFFTLWFIQNLALGGSLGIYPYKTWLR